MGEWFHLNVELQRKRPETMSPALSFLVGVTRFELVTSSVSGKRSPPELNARIQGALFSARNNIQKALA